ncbi:MAG: hypothetical protein JWO36_6049 [Myxococcales bacterium]|nr:hypothetical protein [Myxococcales bacterium]
MRISGSAVFELARAALRRLGAAPPAADVIRGTLQALDETREGPPYTVAIAGEVGARTALLDYLAGERLFDPKRRDPKGTVMTIRRGMITTLRARRRDGSIETHTLGATASGALVVEDSGILEESPADPPPSDPPPPLEETQLVRRIPWWAVWRWLLLWLRARRSRRRRAVEPIRQQIERPIQRIEPAPTTPQKPPVRSQTAPVVDPRRQFRDVLHELLADETLEELAVEVAGGLLPADVIVVELPAAVPAKAADLYIVACGGNGITKTPQLDAMLALAPHIFAVGPVAIPAYPDPRVRRLADFAHVAPRLVKLTALERALSGGGRAIAALSKGRASLDDFLAAAEAGFRKRIDELEARRIANPDEHVAAELARLRPAIIEHAHRSLRRALTRLDTAIARVAAEWADRLREGTSTDALRTAAAKLDEESPANLQAIHAEALRILIDELTEHARAQYLEIVSALREGTSRSDPLPAWLTVELVVENTSPGTALGTVARRLTSLFRSLDSLKADAIEHLDERIATLGQLANAMFADTEPRLEPAVTGTIAVALRQDLERHGIWLEAELVREHAEIDAECARLVPLVGIRDRAINDERELVAAVQALERELP